MWWQFSSLIPPAFGNNCNVKNPRLFPVHARSQHRTPAMHGPLQATCPGHGRKWAGRKGFPTKTYFVIGISEHGACIYIHVYIHYSFHINQRLQEIRTLTLCAGQCWHGKAILISAPSSSIPMWHLQFGSIWKSLGRLKKRHYIVYCLCMFFSWFFLTAFSQHLQFEAKNEDWRTSTTYPYMASTSTSWASSSSSGILETSQMV